MSAPTTDHWPGSGIDALAPNPSAADFVALLKPRVMSLVVFTGLTGLVMAPGHMHPVLALVAILCIAIGAGASGAINMWYDADIDAVMERTANRPIPAGRMSREQALTFGVILAVGSVTVMGLATNWVAAALLALTIGFYVFVYTMFLKRRTPQNIVIGGAAGAFPPMIGWAAVSGDVSPGSIALFALIFFWTPPHFWALGLVKAKEYARAGVPMLPVVAGEKATLRQILLYSVILAPLGVLPAWLGIASATYGLVAAGLGAVFLGLAVRLALRPSNKRAMGLFGYSILYLFLLFAWMLGERAIGVWGV
ncbi:MAG: protoheme IX farnesyltransferase [Alphaproteobacteria bacterium]|nr:protoheme IX farnesyltransferase [Alphaproteobacteria bacterium]